MFEVLIVIAEKYVGNSNFPICKTRATTVRCPCAAPSSTTWPRRSSRSEAMGNSPSGVPSRSFTGWGTTRCPSRLGEKHKVLRKGIFHTLESNLIFVSSLKLLDMLKSPRVDLVLRKDGEHRMSRRQDLELLSEALDKVMVEAKEDEEEKL